VLISSGARDFPFNKGLLKLWIPSEKKEIIWDVQVP
jgi:hypothetical protein